MRRRLLNLTEGDPAQAAIDAATAKRLNDIARLPRLQPHIATRRERERVTEEVIDYQEIMGNQNGGANPAVFQAPGEGLSSRPGALPPSPAAPRSRLSLRGKA